MGGTDGVSRLRVGLAFPYGRPVALLEVHLDREIVAIDVERDVDILRMQIRARWIMKACNFATSEDQPTNGVWISRPAFEPIPKVDRAEFILVGSLRPMVPIAPRETDGRAREIEDLFEIATPGGDV